MTVLVLGDGAEDGESVLGGLVLRTGALGWPLVGLDHRSARTSCLRGGPDDVLAWHLRELRPQAVLVSGLDGEQLLLDPGTVPVVRGNDHDVVEALTAWLGLAGPPVSPAAQSIVEQLPRRRREVAATTLRDRNPRVSLGVSIYNQAAYLHTTMRSLLADEYDDFEVVVLDDGSTDASPQILAQYAGDPRVRIITQSNIGQTGRMDQVNNRIIRESRGELLAVIGGDDVNLPHRLSAQVAAFDDDPGLDVCHSSMSTIDERGQRLDYSFSPVRAYDELSILRMMVLENLVAHPTVMIRRRAHEQVAMYEDGLVSDYEFWLKTAGRLRFRYLPQRLVEYRVHGASTSTTPEGNARCAAEASRLVRKVVLRRSLADFFPELAGSVDPALWYEAGLSLGNDLATVDGHLALHVYELASAAAPGPEALHNSAVVHLLTGDVGAARRAADRAAALDPSSTPLAEGIGRGERFTTSLRRSEHRLTRALAQGRRARGSARRWDGSPVDVDSAYVTFDPSAPGIGERALAQWAELTRPGMGVRWVCPDLGAGMDPTLRMLAEAAAGTDLGTAGDLSIEAVDDLALLPPDARRLDGVLRDLRQVQAFGEWIGARVGAVARAAPAAATGG